jgi:hypothetical protein
MDASTDIDHPRHIKDFTDRLKAIVTESYLQKVCAKYQDEKGFFAERYFVALFRRPNSVAVIWNQKFTKVSGDFVAEALFVQKNGRILVDHAMVW